MTMVSDGGSSDRGAGPQGKGSSYEEEGTVVAGAPPVGVAVGGETAGLVGEVNVAQSDAPIVVRGSAYSPSVRESLTVRGRAVLGLTANELHSIGYTTALAEEDGWIVDRHSYPWTAYVGPRFETDAFLFMLVEEAQG